MYMTRRPTIVRKAMRRPVTKVEHPISKRGRKMELQWEKAKWKAHSLGDPVLLRTVFTSTFLRLPCHRRSTGGGMLAIRLTFVSRRRALGRLVGLDIYVDGCRLWRVASALVGSNHHHVHAFIIIYYSASAQLTLPCDHLLARLITPHELAINETHHERPFAF